ncbi:tripartite tricarboxylate transporter substrate binding protein [Shouchella lehensis]|uniref:Tripartite tricarboxylate transporter substrate binding protein n=1 Tax=Shouchella lehensis TaxID=300825 RepID=A0A4Y7WG01_9BACI|nr:tripartite tricarboxylate transporter substrate-binding protein [Shouchella lehensis]MBG9785113.1 membrane protein [Shouchella lehensis]TES46547.1 tripartite tricarboxylate transporter substrate binding protein [Shouchella lehensis]
MKKWVLACSIIVLIGCSTDVESSALFPGRTVEIIAPATPGGGWDMTARSIQRSLVSDGLLEESITVLNKPGGGGEVGWQYLNQQDSHYAAVNSSLLITSNLLGQSDLSYEDFTPLAMLSTEWLAIASRSDAPFENGAEVMQKLKENPTSLTIGVSPSLGSGNHLAFVQAAVAYGVDPTELQFLVYSSGGDIMNALLGGHIDIATNSVSGFAEQYQVGEVSILAITSEERLDAFPDVPTWTEMGAEMVFPHWRGIMGPSEMADEEVAQWDEWLASMVETEEWNTILENNDLDAFYMNSQETIAFMEEQATFFEEIIVDSGLAP